MRFRVAIALTVILLPFAAGDLRAASAGDRARVVFVESTDVPTRVSRDQAARMYAELVRELNVDPHRLPRVVIFHVSKDIGNDLGVRDVTIRRNSGTTDPPGYYEIWLVGKSGARECILALQNILEQHFNLVVAEEKREAIMKRVLIRTDSTVSARDYPAAVIPKERGGN